MRAARTTIPVLRWSAGISHGCEGFSGAVDVVAQETCLGQVRRRASPAPAWSDYS